MGSLDGPTPLHELSDKKLERAHQRFETIRPFLERGVSLQRIADEQGKSVRTLRYWVSRYKSEGLSGLVHRTRSDSGKHRVREELQEFAKALVLRQQKYTAAHVYEEIAELTKRKGWKPPSYRQVLSIISDIDPQLLKLAHEGTEGHKKAYDLLVRFEATLPNERWQIDHKWLKVWVEDEGEPKKVCLTAVEDDYSRAIAGY